MPRRSGITLLEILTVLGVIVLLVAILVPAVQSSRAAALRMNCAANMRQVGMAVLNYESTFGVYPNGFDFRLVILPELDLRSLYDLADWDNPDDVTAPLNPFSPAIYRCPADPAPALSSYGGEDVGTSNYVGNAGVWLHTYGLNGVFSLAAESHPVEPGRWVRPRDVLDGLSNTAMLSEILAVMGHSTGCGSAGRHPTGTLISMPFAKPAKPFRPIPRVSAGLVPRQCWGDLGMAEAGARFSIITARLPIAPPV